MPCYKSSIELFQNSNNESHKHLTQTASKTVKAIGARNLLIDIESTKFRLLEHICTSQLNYTNYIIKQ